MAFHQLVLQLLNIDSKGITERLCLFFLFIDTITEICYTPNLDARHHINDKKDTMKIIRPTTFPATGSFSRALVAQYTDSRGFIAQAAVDTPRFTYKASNLELGPTLLLESAATNKVKFSSQFNDPTWINLGTTVATNVAPNPADRLLTADRLTANAGNGLHQLLLDTGTPDTGPLTFSVYALRSSVFWINIGFNFQETRYDAYFDLYSGVVGNVANGVTAVIEESGNDWYRCSVSAIGSDVDNAAFIRIHTANGQPESWTATGTEFLYIWQAQFETGLKPTSPIYTSGAPVTRPADVCTSLVVSDVPENDAPLWNSAATYAVGDTVLDLTTHKVFSSAVSSNTNHPPPDTAYWVDTGYDNRWRMFDQSVNSQTTKESKFSVGLLPGERFDSIVGLNVSATSVQIMVDDPIDGIVYSKTFPMVSYGDINDWYEYFYTPISRLTDFYLEDIPPVYSNAIVTVTFNSSGNAAAGALILGLSKTLGFSEWGTKAGIVDYSVKTVDAFGNYTIVPRNFSKRNDYTVQVPTDQVDDIYTTLASYRTTPIVYVGSNSTAKQKFTSTIVYGFYKDFSINISYPAFSVCTMQVEGLA